jgi:hypothetical protein|tara:strand:+ start:455 stop:913 length:459 start_codon:yes stop_codon:yes gene_type:complete
MTNVDTNTGEILTEGNDDYSGWENRYLAEAHYSLNKTIADLKQKCGRIEMELRQRMESLGATQLAAEGYEIIDEGKKVYDFNRLVALREILPDSVISEAFTPAHEETIDVADKWDMRKVQHWPKKYGHDVADIVGRSTTILPGKVAVKKTGG